MKFCFVPVTQLLLDEHQLPVYVSGTIVSNGRLAPRTSHIATSNPQLRKINTSFT